MARKVNLNDGDFKRFKRNQGALATQTPLSSTAVERGSTRWLNGSTVFIEGLLDVTGTTNNSGTFNNSGAFNNSGILTNTGPLLQQGPTTMSGKFTQTGESIFNGPTFMDGPLEITDTLDVSAETRLRGPTTMEADLDIIGGGKLTAGVTKIEPSGKATFGSFIIDPASNKLIQAPGGWMFSDGVDHLGLASSSSSSVNLGGAYAELNFKGKSVRITESSTTINTTITSAKTIYTEKIKISAASTTSQPANVYMTAEGYLQRVT